MATPPRDGSSERESERGRERESVAPGEHRTEEHRPGTRRALTVRRFRLNVVEGAEARAWESAADRCSVGSHPSNDLTIDDTTVSRFHCEIRVERDGVLLRDLGSRNGTLVDGVAVREAFLRSGSIVQIGRIGLRFATCAEKNPVVVSERTELGSMVGVSFAMRAVFALLERVAESDVTVLLEGETGTGKGAAAESIHREGSRRDGPFVVVDCSALPSTLLESELFGHEKGAYTGADGRRIGAFEEASGGTLFLDEIGELPLDLQPKLLRALEERMVRRIGGNAYKQVDLRIIAATNRDLRTEVNEKRFRADLYYRLAVARITLPPLRERREDVATLVEAMLKRLGATDEAASVVRSPEAMEQLRRGAWPGNIRELRNHLERCLVFRTAPGDGEGESASGDGMPESESGGGYPVDLSVPFQQARRLASEAFERSYLMALVAAHGSKTVQAAAAAEIDRVHLYRMLRRHGLR